MKRIYVRFILLFLFPALAATGQQDTVAMRYAALIKANEISVYLHKLASPEFEGRETAQKGQKLAGEYIAGEFAKMGIPPLKNGTYFFDVPLKTVHPDGMKITVSGKDYEVMDDFLSLSNFRDTSFSLSSVLFLGYGIKEEKYNDLEGADVAGKAVLVLNGEPYNKKNISYVTGDKTPSPWSVNFRKKQNLLKEYKPSVIFIVVDSLQKSFAQFKRLLSAPSLKLDMEKREGANIPCIYISREMADRMLAASGKTADDLKKAIDKKGKPVTLETKTEVQLKLERRTEKTKTENVIAFIEGSDPKLKEEVVVVSAHYDHLGKKEDKIYFGADDDGSGTSAIMQLAKVIAIARKEGKGPRRSILFLATTGEEKGLLGSEAYVNNPIVPLEKTVANLNIDMIGRLDEKHKDNPDYTYIIGSDKLSTELHAISEKANTSYTRLELDYTYNKPDDPNRFYYRSDHYNFAKNNIPVIFYFTGVHEDYHKPTDTPDKIDFNKIEKIGKLVFYTLWELANRDEKIKVDVQSDFKNDR